MNKITLVCTSNKYLIPYTPEDYIFLAKKSIRTTRVSKNFLPTLKYICQGTEVEEILWKDIFLKAIDKTKNFWIKRDKCTFGYEKDNFKLSGPKTEENKKALSNIEISWRKFFNRWGLNSEFLFSETTTKVTLSVIFEFSEDRMPEISLEGEDVSIEPAILEFPFTRFKLSLGERYFELTQEDKVGGNWIYTKTYRVFYGEVKNLHFIETLFDVLNHEVR